MAESVRTDKWLWATRFFKTRSQATKACADGNVKRGGTALKPASPIYAGDVLEVPFAEGPGLRSITVTGLIEKRVGAKDAAEFFVESTSEAVLHARREAWQQRKERREGDQGRPTKRNRRAIQQIRGYFG